ncbi:MAG: PAS domain S-box protein, partial [Desulfobacterales bacterium]
MANKPTYEELEKKIVVYEIAEAERKQTEEALRESEERFRLLSESSPLGVFQTDSEGRVLYLNSKWLEITGMSKEDALGFGWSESLHPEDRPRVLADWAKCLEEGVGYDGEFRFVRPSGEVRWTHTQSAPAFSTFGEVISHVGTNKDITERREAEEALRESENIFRLFMEHSPIYVFFKDENIRSIRLSSNYEQMLGKPIDELLGRTMDEIFPSDLAKAMIADDLRILNGGKPVTIEEEFNGRSYETTKFPIVLDGKAKYLAGHTIDITERKQAEAEFAAEKEFTEKALSAQIDTFFVFDPSTGRAVRWNKAFNEISGYSDEEIQSMKAPESYYNQEDLEKATITIEKVLAGGEAAVEMSLITKDGRTIPTEYSASAVLDDDEKPGYIIAVGRDIRQRIEAADERRALEGQLQQAQKMEAIGTLAGGIAHDFNNILGVIVGNAELGLMDLPERNPVFKKLQAILKASMRASDMVRQILTYSRQTTEDFRPMELTPVVVEALKMLRSSIPSTIEIRQDVIADIDTIRGD